MRGMRRLSQAISEGDGISVIAEVGDADAAGAAEAAGAEALLASSGSLEEVRGATSLPIIWRAGSDELAAQTADADAYLIDGHPSLVADRISQAEGAGLECVVRVNSGDDLEELLETVDPEIFLLAPGEKNGDGGPLERVLDLLPSVPAGKLAIADVGARTRDEVVELERAGVDAVIVTAANIAELVGAPPPEV